MCLSKVVNDLWKNPLVQSFVVFASEALVGQHWRFCSVFGILLKKNKKTIKSTMKMPVIESCIIVIFISVGPRVVITIQKTLSQVSLCVLYPFVSSCFILILNCLISVDAHLLFLSIFPLCVWLLSLCLICVFPCVNTVDPLFLMWPLADGLCCLMSRHPTGFCSFPVISDCCCL